MHLGTTNAMDLTADWIVLGSIWVNLALLSAVEKMALESTALKGETEGAGVMAKKIMMESKAALERVEKRAVGGMALQSAAKETTALQSAAEKMAVLHCVTEKTVADKMTKAPWTAVTWILKVTCQI